MAKRPPPPIKFSRLPEGVQNAGAWRIERQQRRGTVADVLHISDKVWKKGHYRFICIEHLAKQDGPLTRRIEQLGLRLDVSSRTIERWLRIYRKNPDIMALMPKARGPTIGHRRVIPERENLLREVIDDWARSGQRLPVSWIQEECRRRGKSTRVDPPSRSCITARLRDRGLESLRQRRLPSREAPAPTKPPRSPGPLKIVQMDHTLVDVMVVDEVRRESMGRPWITVAFDIATRVVLGFHLSLHAPSAVSVGLALAMTGLPKEQWLAERSLELDWPMFGLPKALHLDNAAEFHSVALSRGCERYGIGLEYRPPGRPYFGGHIERYLGTLMRRIHGLPGTTYSSPEKRGRYRSAAKATMTMAELERWITLEIAGRYHHFVHRGLHAVPFRLWKRAAPRLPKSEISDPARFMLDFLPAETRKIGREGFQIGRVRYWDPVLSRLFPFGTQVLVRYNPRDLSKVFVPAPEGLEYLSIPYADLRRPPMTLAELDRSRAILTAKGDASPSEDRIFATMEEQRRIENAAAKSTRKARRRTEQRPRQVPAPKKPLKRSKIDWTVRADPYDAEVWWSPR